MQQQNENNQAGGYGPLASVGIIVGVSVAIIVAVILLKAVIL